MFSKLFFFAVKIDCCPIYCYWNWSSIKEEWIGSHISPMAGSQVWEALYSTGNKSGWKKRLLFQQNFAAEIWSSCWKSAALLTSTQGLYLFGLFLSSSKYSLGQPLLAAYLISILSSYRENLDFPLTKVMMYHLNILAPSSSLTFRDGIWHKSVQ